MRSNGTMTLAVGSNVENIYVRPLCYLPNHPHENTVQCIFTQRDANMASNKVRRLDEHITSPKTKPMA
jgi:hypothetical protein